MTKEIGSQYKAQREALGLTQQQVADQLGISRTQLSRLENGVRNITDEMKAKLDDIFSVNDSLKFEDLEAGDYVYIRDDLVDGAMYGEWSWHDDMEENTLLEVEEVDCGGYIHNGMVYTRGMIYLSKSMKREDYLKMQEKEYSFDDLIDIVSMANKDRVISGYAVIGSKVNCLTIDGEDYNLGIGDDVEHGIRFIQSLYQEEFVIETMADELRVKSGAELTLANGMKCIYFDDGDRKLRHDGDFYPCNFLVLKGATVKKSKGIK